MSEVKDATARDNAIRIAKTDTKASLQAARRITDPWYRAQALAWVARFTKIADGAVALTEAQAASQDAGDAYKVVASSTWWLRAMIELGNGEKAVRHVQDLIKLATTIEPGVSRLDALFLLFQASFDVEPARRLCTGALVDACRKADSWKAPERLRDAALMLAGEHPTEAKQVVEAMPDGKHKQQAERRIAANEFMKPRQFFW